jgi:hypothetical protein
LAKPGADSGDDLGDAAGGEVELGGDFGLGLAVDDDAVEDFLVAAGGDAGTCAALVFGFAGVHGALEDGGGVIGHGLAPWKNSEFRNQNAEIGSRLLGAAEAGTKYEVRSTNERAHLGRTRIAWRGVQIAWTAANGRRRRLKGYIEKRVEKRAKNPGILRGILEIIWGEVGRAEYNWRPAGFAGRRFL